uniref:Uncharacterized protein n=1 Tax=viral metagenome TaxID=1070528 RepID=A0A6C0D9Q7_9ZZZZ
MSNYQSSENIKSQELISKISDVQNSYAELQKLEREFKSTLEIYNTAKRTLTSDTTDFILDNDKIPRDSKRAKNIFVNKAVNNPLSKYVGIYKTNKESSEINHLDGTRNYMDCQVAAINNGSKYFTLSDVNESTGKARCSMTNSLNEITIGGIPIEKCSKDDKDGQIYSNDMGSYALYSADGNLTNFVGCYNDDEKNHAMTDVNSLKNDDEQDEDDDIEYDPLVLTGVEDWFKSQGGNASWQFDIDFFGNMFEFFDVNGRRLRRNDKEKYRKAKANFIDKTAIWVSLVPNFEYGPKNSEELQSEAMKNHNVPDDGKRPPSNEIRHYKNQPVLDESNYLQYGYGYYGAFKYNGTKPTRCKLIGLCDFNCDVVINAKTIAKNRNWQDGNIHEFSYTITLQPGSNFIAFVGFYTLSTLLFTIMDTNNKVIFNTHSCYVRDDGSANIDNPTCRPNQNGDMTVMQNSGIFGIIYSANLKVYPDVYRNTDSHYAGYYAADENFGFIKKQKTGAMMSISKYPKVFVAADYNRGPWGRSNFIDPKAKWVWYTPNAAANAPVNNIRSAMTLFNIFTYNGSQFRDVEIRGHCDNIGVIYLNGKKLGKKDMWWDEFNYKAKIQPGTNTIAVSVINEGGPAGLILTVKEANSNWIFIDTDENWRYTNQTPESLVPMKQDFSVATCAKMAKGKGYKYFSVQGGNAGSSLCYVTNDLNSTKKYGTAELTYKGNDGITYGRNNVDATYEVQTPGYLKDVGKLGWMDNDNSITEYPRSMYKVVDDMPQDIKFNRMAGREILYVDSIEWHEQLMNKISAKYPTMSDDTKCGLARRIQEDQSRLDALIAKLQEMSKIILNKIEYLEQLDVDTIQQVGINKNLLDDMLKKYSSYNKDFSQYITEDNYTYEGIVDDSKVVVAQKNYSYLLWSSVAIVTLIITLIVIKNRS